MQGIVAPIMYGTAITIALLLATPFRSQVHLALAQPTVTSRQVEAIYTQTHTAYLPLVQIPPPWVDTRSRQASKDDYFSHYLTSSGAPINWTGNLANCIPGTTSLAFRAAVLQRVNYYRGMAGVPDTVVFSDTLNQKAQAAALMMSRNTSLSHTPPSSWLCYSADGAAGAGSSNLALGINGPAAIDLYMADNGLPSIGHRRWILYPQTKQMGTGDIPSNPGYLSTNALTVFDGLYGSARPRTREAFVAWPPPGYVPYPVVYANWSFAYAWADFSVATVVMTSGGAVVPVTRFTPQDGFGENTLVWSPQGIATNEPGSISFVDTTYHVTISNVIVGSQHLTFNYDVTLFDPNT